MFAAGGVAIEGWAARFLGQRTRRILGFASFALLLIGGIVFLPISLPILPPAETGQFAQSVGLVQPMEKGKDPELPQYLADRIGWELLVLGVRDVVRALPAEQQAEATVLASNYGEASAINFLGRAYDLPPAVSGHNSYYLWGPGTGEGGVVIAIDFPLEELESAFEEVRPLATVRSRFSAEGNIALSLALRSTVPVAELWPQVKHYE
jgi:hypothetical protein